MRNSNTITEEIEISSHIDNLYMLTFNTVNVFWLAVRKIKKEKYYIRYYNKKRKMVNIFHPKIISLPIT